MIGGHSYARRFVRAFIAALACLFSLSVVPAFSFAKDVTLHGFVRWVVDGDTVILEGGETVRYVGIDTPEKGEPFYKEARRRNIELVKGKAITLVVCAEDPKDKYGRTLGWVWVGAVSVNEVLLKEGLARTLVIPPCGLRKKKDYARFESEAKGKRAGIWGVKR